MNQKIIDIKLVLVSIIAYLSSKLGILAPILLMLVIVVIIDHFSGMIASSINGQLSSKKGYKGILKKLSYFIAVSAAMILDWLVLLLANEIGIKIEFPTFVSGLVAVWLILNELLSILENLKRSGVKLPNFLQNLIQLLIDRVETEGEPRNGKDKKNMD